jgi:hypothetical protein
MAMINKFKADFEAGRISAEEYAVKLEAQLATMKRGGSLTIKVSAKGAVSVYGLGKWPVTLYQSQWDRLLGAADAIREFIAANESDLAAKE